MGLTALRCRGNRRRKRQGTAVTLAGHSGGLQSANQILLTARDGCLSLYMIRHCLFCDPILSWVKGLLSNLAGVLQMTQFAIPSHILVRRTGPLQLT